MDSGREGREQEGHRNPSEGLEREFTAVFMNARSIIRKIEELKCYLVEKNPDMVMITEAWTNDSISDDFLTIKGYELVAREDRKDTGAGRGGGILVYAKREINCWREEEDNGFNQSVSIRVKLDEEIVIHVVYRSPNSSKQNDDALCSWVRGMKGSRLVLGDFNLPGIEWEAGRADAKGREFYRACCDTFLEQLVIESTHINGNRLDLVLTNRSEKIKGVDMDGRLDKSDHEIIVVQLHANTQQTSSCQRYRDFIRAEYKEARREIADVDWVSELEGKNVNETWKSIRNKVAAVIEEYVPLKKKRGINKPKWYNKELERLIRKKRQAWNKWKKTKKAEDKEEYYKLERETKGTIRRRKKGLEKNIAKDAKKNPKAYYAYINSGKNARRKVGPLKVEVDGQMVVVSEPKKQAEILNSCYASVFTRRSGQAPTKEREPNTPEISYVCLDEEKLKATIQELKEDSAPGPDAIPNRFMKETVDEISLPLSILFSKSLKERKIPDEWRTANVTPIYKKGSKSEPGNYRPVSLTSSVGKLMEKIVKQAIENHVESNSLIRSTQHGFRNGRSPQTNLIEFLEQTTTWSDEGKPFDIIYVDFAKAFDKVCHASLIAKLKAKGVDGDLLAWLENWLSGRKQRVVVEGEMSASEDVESGVIQGSVLGGILFIIFVDDLDDWILALIRKFADDTKIARVVENEAQARELQRDIDRLVQWAKTWGMQFNVKKCKVMHCGRKNRRFEYKMGDEKLEEVEEEKDLGVWIHSSMKPSTQCERAANSANKALGMMFRAFHYRTTETLVPLFKTFVRPTLEFACSAWSPWTAKDEETLEVVQKRLVRALSNVQGASYEERLEKAGLTTLKDRRIRGDLIEAFKTLKGFNRVDRGEWFDVRSNETSRPTRGNTAIVDGTETKKTEILYKKPATNEIRNNFYTIRVTRSWNELPEEVKNAKTVNSFKTAYDSWKGRQNPNR